MKDFMPEFSDLIHLCDDTVTTVTVGHIFRGDIDRCLEYFGEQTDECIAHNLTKEFEDKDFIPGA